MRVATMSSKALSSWYLLLSFLSSSSSLLSCPPSSSPPSSLYAKLQNIFEGLMHKDRSSLWDNPQVLIRMKIMPEHDGDNNDDNDDDDDDDDDNLLSVLGRHLPWRGCPREGSRWYGFSCHWDGREVSKSDDDHCDDDHCDPCVAGTEASVRPRRKGWNTTRTGGKPLYFYDDGREAIIFLFTYLYNGQKAA